MDVLALPYGRNLDAWDELESDFLGLVFGEFVGIQVVVVRDGNATQPLALAKCEEFVYGESTIGKAGVQVQIRVSATLGNDWPSTVHLPTP
jgi:hypothetical protein